MVDGSHPGGLLEEMAASSRTRAREARKRLPEREVRSRIADLPPPRTLVPSAGGFDVIAEVKRRAPSTGDLQGDGSGSATLPVDRASAYAEAGAAAVSVLTEPDRFEGSLQDLAAVAGAVPVPVLRKDFLVDPYQVFEARLAGASGVLLIARMLGTTGLREMTAASLDAGLFVLAEAFDRDDLGRIGEVRGSVPEDLRARVLVGLNARDLATLRVDRRRFRDLAGSFPDGCARVAESGIESEEHAADVARAGYGTALVGSALMRAGDPAALARAMIAAGREARVVR